MCFVLAPGYRCGNSGTGQRGFPHRRHRSGRWNARLQAGRSRVFRRRLDAGPLLRPLEDFASDEAEQSKLYWTDERIFTGGNPVQLGSNNSGKSVGGSTVHFAMVSLRFRPEWFKSRSLLGYGADWPLDWREMWHYYAEVEQALKIAGPVTYPWGPKRPRYPYRAHELNAAAKVLAIGGEAMGIRGPKPRSPPYPHRAAPHRPVCIAGSARRLLDQRQAERADDLDSTRHRAGAEIRDLAMAGRIETNAAGLATGVHYVAKAGGAFSMPRTSSWPAMRSKHPDCCCTRPNRYPNGLANARGWSADT